MKVFLALLLVAVIILGAAIIYIRPASRLSLDYVPLSIQDQVSDMIRSLSTQTELSEEEVQSLIRQSVAAKPELRPGIRVTGLEISLQDGELLADVNALVKERIPVGARLRFELSWDAPYLVARHTGTRVKRLDVPTSWFRLEPIRIKLDDRLPKLVTVRQIGFSGSDIILQLGLR